MQRVIHLITRRANALMAIALVAMVVGVPVLSLQTYATAPPADRSAFGASGSGRNGHGGSIAPSGARGLAGSWPGTANNFDGGPFAFVGAQYGALWKIPAGTNNSRGVGYCVMEDVAGTGTVTARPDPAGWSPKAMASAAALMATFGGDRVVPYGMDASGTYDVASGEWLHPALAAEPTRRRQIAVNFGVRLFLPDQSPTGVVSGRTLSRSSSVVGGSGSDFAALQAGYGVAQHAATMADRQHAVGGIILTMVWGTPGGVAPREPGRYRLEVRVSDSTGKPVGHVPVLQLTATGIDANRSEHVTVSVDNGRDTGADRARWTAAAAAGWPTWGMNLRLVTDPRFAVGANPNSADVTDERGVARFDVTIQAEGWQLAFHAQAPTNDVVLYAGTGIQGNVTWTGRPQSASVHQRGVVADRHVVVVKTSSDPAVATTGTVFALLDGAGGEVGRATVGVDGRATFPPFSPTRFAPPYRVRELVAAPGLTKLTTDVPVTGPLSTDPAAPTMVPIANTATAGELRVVKRLDVEEVQGDRDMSGFVFRVDQVATGRTVGEVATAADGVTPPLTVVRGDYRVTEIGRPPWALNLTDPGPATTSIDPGAEPGRRQVTVDYVNRIPTMTIDTEARDAADGDQVLDHTSTRVVDHVTVCGAVVGTPYVARGAIHRVDGSRVVPTGITATFELAPTAPCVEFDMHYTVPADATVRGSTAVVFVEIAAAGRAIASHADPADASQTIELRAAPPPPPVTTIPAVVPTTPPPPTSVAILPPPVTAPPAVALPPTGARGAATAARFGGALASIGAGALVATRIHRTHRNVPGRRR